jgi:hypothetical protein
MNYRYTLWAEKLGGHTYIVLRQFWTAMVLTYKQDFSKLNMVQA